MGFAMSLSDVVKRVLEYSEKTKTPPYEMSLLMKISPGNYTHFKNGETKNPTVRPFVNLIENSKINPEWLFLGIGLMLREESPAVKAKRFDKLCEECEAELESWRSRALRAEGALDYIKQQSLPPPDPAPPHLGGRRPFVKRIAKAL